MIDHNQDDNLSAHQRWNARLEQWAKRPENLDSNWTVVRCFHSYHGDLTYYLSAEEYMECFLPITRSLWVNGYTFLVQPGDNLETSDENQPCDRQRQVR